MEPDEGNPFWGEVVPPDAATSTMPVEPEAVEHGEMAGTSTVASADSGLGSSLLCMSTTADATLDVSRESGELSEDEPIQGQPIQGNAGTDGEEELQPYNHFSFYVARSLAEWLVLDNCQHWNCMEFSSLLIQR